MTAKMISNATLLTKSLKYRKQIELPPMSSESSIGRLMLLAFTEPRPLAEGNALRTRRSRGGCMLSPKRRCDILSSLLSVEAWEARTLMVMLFLTVSQGDVCVSMASKNIPVRLVLRF
eukprot:CAMPEP_0115180914 /NCGR_PEP_ID=MMETSP0270-20121206/7164_1 /TAXON_ID=71861 /ORGANISM="Scrippsiella trochoidea, Strain CCMP3099" /LENGTH=117 /DNA_ID=CAMNT_0002593927 /DNA_START=328 /DNA_END=681 /DNA_ORIENTATION=+